LPIFIDRGAPVKSNDYGLELPRILFKGSMGEAGASVSYQSAHYWVSSGANVIFAAPLDP